MQRVSVKVAPDHVASLAKTSRPMKVITELVWNACDADAGKVDVSLRMTTLGALAQVVVADDGHGMTHEESLTQFGQLGGSWKLLAATSRSGERALHGRKGQGRFLAFAIARRATWVTVAGTPDGRQRTVIRGSASNPTAFDVEDPEPSDAPTGTVVTLDIDEDAPTSPLTGATAGDDLTFPLALYLKKYPHVAVAYEGTRIDPGSVEAASRSYDLAPEDTGSRYPALLTVVEWTKDMGRALVLCNEDGLALAEHQPRIHAPGFNFTAYISSREFQEIGAATLEVANMHERVEPIIEAAQGKLRAHFRERAAEKTADRITKWKREDVYPYRGKPATPLEEVERQVFDVVAVSVADGLDGFESGDNATRRFSFRLLREALERNPSALHKIIGDVLELPDAEQRDLAELLERTTLTAIIKASRLVADRLDFLTALDTLLFDEDVGSTRWSATTCTSW